VINEFLDAVAARIHDAVTGAFGGLFNFIPEIWFWYWWLFLLFLLTGVIIWFFGWSKIVRMVASLSFLIAAVFVAGGAVMARRLKARDKLNVATKPKLPPAPRPEEQRGGPWTWPWSS
jgi:hypothetical protein